MSGANAIVVDNEVTSKLEGALSRINGLVKLKSRTWGGGGRLTLRLDKDVDIDAVRFEVSTVIRQLYTRLPVGVGYPRINSTGGQDEDRPERLMSFTLTGLDSNPVVGDWAEKHLVPAFSEVEGIQEVYVYGAFPYEWELEYKEEAFKKIGISSSKLIDQIRDYYRNADLGQISELTDNGSKLSTPVVYRGLSHEVFEPDKIKIRHEGRLFKLTDLVLVKKLVQKPRRYARINGLNAINVIVLARGSANFVVSGDQLKAVAKEMIQDLPKGYSLQMTYDASEFVKDELQTIILRVLASLFILLLFVYLVTRSFRYFIIITLSILVNIITAFICYYFLGVTIHVYSLAGLAISLGIVMDNTIVVVDQLRNNKGMNVIRAVVAATLTTIGSLLIVWFLEDETKLKLLDFTWVVVINLSLSLLVSFFFIPALMDKLPLSKRNLSKRMTKSRRVVKFSRFYIRSVFWMKGKRWLLWLLLIIGFGLPVFMLPAHVKGDAFYAKWYNKIFGARFYSETIKPVTDVALGGVLRLFVQENKGKKFNRSAKRTTLNVSGTMDDGTTMEQTNQVIKRVENFLLQFEEIDQFHTSIYSPSSTRINIQFKEEAEHDGFPHQLKSRLEQFCIDLGGADWKIAGVGRAFDNSLREGRRNNRMVLYGYNLDELKGYADKLKNYLLEIERVDDKSIFINGRATHSSKIHREYELAFDEEKMRRTGVSLGGVLGNLRKMSQEKRWVMGIATEGRNENIYMKIADASVPDIWEFYNRPLDLGKERYTKLRESGRFAKKRQQRLINKEDMQYTMVVEFDFIGSWGQQQYFLGQVRDRLHQQLPIGYFLKPLRNYGGSWGKKQSGNKKLWLVLLVVGIIYFVSSVVFNSLLQPLLVILLIPVSFIGSFLTFYLFQIPFNEGGFAALVLLSGLTVNSVIYILNDLNQLRKNKPNLPQEKLYTKAFNQKIIPILLTIISTVLGLAPFLFGNESNLFWLSLSAGTIGGLVFSITGILLVLPVFVRIRSNSRHKMIR